MFQFLWSGMVIFSVVFAAVRGESGALFSAAISSAESAIALTLKLAAGYAFFCGLIEVMKGLGAQRALARLLAPLTRRLFPTLRDPETKEAIVMNFTANMLGLGNAATPMGVRAMERMAAERERGADVSDAICLFLVINATSLQLLPTTVLSLRAAAGSARPEAILLPTLLCTAASTVTGTLAALLCAKHRHG